MWRTINLLVRASLAGSSALDGLEEPLAGEEPAAPRITIHRCL